MSEVAKTLQNYFSPKNMTRFYELYFYLASGTVLDTLYMNPNMKKMKSDWQYLMKNISTRLDLVE